MSEIVSQETQMTLQELRAEARQRPLTREELKRALELMRGDRVRASAVSAKAKTTKAAAGKVVDSDDLLNQLEEL